jgi:hypothetical protein
LLLGAAKTAIIDQVSAAVNLGTFEAMLAKLKTPAACANEHLWYALEADNPGELKNILECD